MSSGTCALTGLVVDGSNIYSFALTGCLPDSLVSGTLMAKPLGGGSATKMSQFSIPYPFPPRRLIAVDASNLYAADFDGQYIFRYPKGTTTGSLMTTNALRGAPVGVVAGDGNVYWDDNGAAVWKQAATGGSITQLASGGGSGFLALDATHVYFAGGGALARVSTTGSTPQTLVPTGVAGPLAIDDTHVVYTTSTAVMMVGKTGGTPVTIAADQGAVADVAVDSSGVYWLTSSAVKKRVF